MAAVALSSGVKLHYVDAGTGDPPLLFVHGWCCDHTFYEPQFEHFKSRHRVVALDLRGCGKSDKPASGYDIPTLTDDVAALCKEAGVERPVVIGHSLGGMMCVDLAARYPSIPRAIVADDPGPLAITPESRAVFEALLTAMEGPDSDRARRDYIGQMFSRSDDPERCRRITETMCSVPLPIALAMLRGVVTWSGQGMLSLITAPMLMLRCEPGGGNDPSRISGFKSDVMFGITAGAGHFHQLEVPDQVNAMIERFLETLP
jgi:pimeloyl-ACP methyl ester carboxylesterase